MKWWTKNHSKRHAPSSNPSNPCTQLQHRHQTHEEKGVCWGCQQWRAHFLACTQDLSQAFEAAASFAEFAGSNWRLVCPTNYPKVCGQIPQWHVGSNILPKSDKPELDSKQPLFNLTISSLCWSWICGREDHPADLHWNSIETAPDSTGDESTDTSIGLDTSKRRSTGKEDNV
jgi:hypothetical protein